MKDFDFQIKTKIYFGRGKELETGNILKELGAKKVYVVIGMGSVKSSGLLDKVLNTLKQNGIDYKILEGVRANPKCELVKVGLEEIREYKPDFLLAIGGGSVIDTAKSLAVGYYYDGDPFDFNLHIVKPKKALPIGVVLTISAAGSEMSTSCVIQSDETGTKIGFNSELVRPVFVVENPELTYSVSKEQTGYGIVDILMHTLERYFQPSEENEPADGFAEALIKSVMKAGSVAINDPKDYEARAVLMVMSSMSHNGLMNLGKPVGMPVHALEHALSGIYPHVAHGAGLAVIFPKWARYYAQFDVDKFDKFARNVFGLTNEDKLQNALDGINALDEYFTSLKMPKTYKDLGIEDIDIDKLVRKLTNDGTRVIGHHVKPLDQDVAYEIFKMCI